MAHNLDTTAGQTSFVSAREDAWHQLGTTLPQTFTAEEAMTHGLLGGWNVRKAPVFTVLPDGTMREKADQFDIIRDNPVVPGQIDVLTTKTVTSRYTEIQNEEHAEMLNTLVDESGAHFETAGALDGGRKVFVTMKLPGHMKVGGVDAIENYIAAINSHDGSSSFVLLVTPIRIVCQNTMNLAFGKATNEFRIRHTRGAGAVLRQQAREALDMTFDYLDGFQEQAEQLINTKLSEQRFLEIITAEFGAPKDAAPATVTRAENKLDEMHRLFVEGNTQEGVRHTAWAGLNAVTEWADHFAPTRGEEGTRDVARNMRAVLAPALKNKALDLMLAEV